LLIQKR